MQPKCTCEPNVKGEGHCESSPQPMAEYDERVRRQFIGIGKYQLQMLKYFSYVKSSIPHT